LTPSLLRPTISPTVAREILYMIFSGIHIQEKRLEQDLAELGKFGWIPEAGIARPALSPADLAARAWLQDRMRDAGLEVREDAAANLIGRWNPESGNHPCIAFGSHTDAVPNGGKFDGALGVCAGLEAIRAIRESGIAPPCSLELVILTDEEGSHYAGTFGSRAMLGLLTEGEIYKSKGEKQPSLAHSLKRMGKDPEKVGEAVRSSTDFLAFLELHIEQGPVLESLGVPVGIVQGIVAIERYAIRVEGLAGHAGTTPMRSRDDALVKASRVIVEIHDTLSEMNIEAVGTIGALQVYPGAFNIIPGAVDLFLDLRAMEKSHLDLVRDRIRGIVARQSKVTMNPLLAKAGVSLDPRIMKAVENSCRQRKIPWHYLGSGAGHDAMTFQTKGIPTGMIFIPCVEGRSHCPEEAIRFEDAVSGTRVLADSILRLAFDQPH
jgi:beta-ureidopropionase / N-carbamoyl-L-amino-acid hydrolase